MTELEMVELKVKLLKKKYDIEQAILDQKRAQARIDALQKDIDRYKNDENILANQLENINV